MHKLYFYTFFLFLIGTTSGFAGNNVQVYFEKNDHGYKIYADNKEHCPASVKIDFEVTNLNIKGGNGRVYLLDPLKEKQLLTTLSIRNKNKAYSLKYTFKWNIGNHNLKQYDSDFMYDLPFSQSNSFQVYQGYNGDFSHQNKNALDFSMPVGTEIKAVREGVVIEVQEENSKSCPTEDCKKYNNYIIMYHPDGTFAEYSHIKKNGSLVQAGDKVEQGTTIGYSGNVGYSTGPHLHLVIFLQKLENRETLRTKFKVGKGENFEYLVEKEEYGRDY